MSTPFIGEIKQVSFNFAPKGWALCNGQILAITENETLFNLIGTTYGGDGQTTFALPNFQGRAAVHTGGSGGYFVGQLAGSDTATLTTEQLPAHSHEVHASTLAPNASDPRGAVMGATSSFVTPGGNTHMKPVADTGGGQPFSVVQPVLCVNFIIALSGIYPSQS